MYVYAYIPRLNFFNSTYMQVRTIKYNSYVLTQYICKKVTIVKIHWKLFKLLQRIGSNVHRLNTSAYVINNMNIDMRRITK